MVRLQVFLHVEVDSRKLSAAKGKPPSAGVRPRRFCDLTPPTQAQRVYKLAILGVRTHTQAQNG